MHKPTDLEIQIVEETTRNRDRYGNMYMNYVSEQLPMIVDQDNVQVIARIRKMSYEEFQQFDIYPIPAKISDRFQIMAWRMVRTLKRT